MRTLSIILLNGIAVGVGVLCILFSLGHLDAYEIFTVFLNYLDDQYGKAAIGLTGVLIIVLWLQMLLTIGRSFRLKRIVISESKENASIITVSAVEEIIKKMVLGINGVRDIRVKIIPAKKNIKVFVYFVLFSGVNIAELLQDAQNKVRQKISGIVGEDKKILIKTEVRKVVSSKNEDVNKWEMQVPYREYS